MGARWLGCSKAAKALGVSPRGLRKRGVAGTVARKLNPDKLGEWLYQVDSSEPVAPAVQHVEPESDASELVKLLTSKTPEVSSVQGKSPVQERVWRVVTLADVHIPEHDTLAFEASLEFIQDTQPDEIILLGDFLELESCSQHGGVARPKLLVDEMKAGRKYLRRIRDAAPRARMVYIGGNHEDRLARVTVAALPTFDGALALERLLDLDSVGVQWIPYDSDPYFPEHPSGVKSDLGYWHGLWGQKYHANKHIEEHGRSIRYGHLHAWQVYARNRADRLLCGLATPCLRTLNPSWRKGPNTWLQGLGDDHVFADGRFAPGTHIINNGLLATAGKVYGRRHA